MNTEAIHHKRSVNVKLPLDIAAMPKGNRIWGKNYIVLCDRVFTDLQYKILIESLIMDREVYGLQFLL